MLLSVQRTGWAGFGLKVVASAFVGSPRLDTSPSAALPRAVSFTCPIFDSFKGTSHICDNEDVIWDGKAISGNQVFLYVVPHASLRGSEHLDDVLEAIQQATMEGLQAYRSFKSGFRINMGVVATSELPLAHGKAQSVRDSDGDFSKCNVLIRHPADTTPTHILGLKKTVVHELYHCAQYAQNIEAWDDGLKALRDWWVESTARFFDGVLYPVTEARRGVINVTPSPENYDPIFPLISQPYTAALWFHYLHQAGISTSQINAWVASKEGRDAGGEQRDVSKSPMFTRNWHGFARAFVDDSIRYTSKIPIRLENTLWPRENTTVSLGRGKKREETYGMTPFRFGLDRCFFPKGTSHRIIFPAEVDCSVREVGGGSWLLATGSEFTVEANRGDVAVEVLGSCAKGVTCVGTLEIRRVS